MSNKITLTLVEKIRPRTLEELKEDWEKDHEVLEKQGLGKKVSNSEGERFFKWNLTGCTPEQQERLHRLADDMISGKIVPTIEGGLIEL